MNDGNNKEKERERQEEMKVKMMTTGCRSGIFVRNDNDR